MYFCLNCLTLKEEETLRAVNRILGHMVEEDFLVWFPKRELSEKTQGQFRQVEKPMFPSYIFIYWNGERELDFPFHEIHRIPTVIRFLGYDDGSHALKGKDLSFAKWIHMHNGYIKQSKVVYREGQKVHICEGPLLGLDGNVVKIDKHHKRITLRFEIGSTCSDISFSVEFLERNSQSGALSINQL